MKVFRRELYLNDTTWDKPREEREQRTWPVLTDGMVVVDGSTENGMNVYDEWTEEVPDEVIEDV